MMTLVEYNELLKAAIDEINNDLFENMTNESDGTEQIAVHSYLKGLHETLINFSWSVNSMSDLYAEFAPVAYSTLLKGIKGTADYAYLPKIKELAKKYNEML